MCAHFSESLIMLLQMICIKAFYEFSGFKDSLVSLNSFLKRNLLIELRKSCSLKSKYEGTVLTAYRATM